MEPISLKPEYIDTDRPETVYTHVEYPWGDHPALSRFANGEEVVVAICGFAALSDNVLWHDEPERVNCPVCFRIIVIGNSVSNERLRAIARNRRIPK